MNDPRLTESYWPADPTDPVLETTCGGVLRTAAERAPDAVALIAGAPDPAARRRISYAELLTEAERAARALLGRFEPGERVAVWAPNSPQWTILQFGAALAGMTLVTVNPLYRVQELRHVLSQSRAAGIFLALAVRGVSTADILDTVRPQLPGLRDSVPFTDWDAFCDSGSATEPLPEVDPGAAGEGEQVAAFIQPAAGSPPAAADLDAFCRQRLAGFKVPRHWQMVDAFPMTGSGKVQTFALRDRFTAGAPRTR